MTDKGSNSKYGMIRQEYYGSLDGLRTISCFSIIAMHIRANTAYNLSGFVWDTFIPSLTWLVYLFLMISGFGMCTGYLFRFQNNTVDLESFYKRRYGKILPFFGFLILISLVLEPSLYNIYEASVELTLLHGLLPNNEMNVLGVCWTLGVIFLFYLLFPFFSVLMRTKKRAWMTLVVSLWINFICENYFFGEQFVTQSFTPRHSFIYCIPLFVGGGLIYLYRENIKEFCGRFRWLFLTVCIIATVVWYIMPSSIGTYSFFFYISWVLFMLWLAYAVGIESKVLSNKIMKFFGNMSLEMYLAHMVIFRLVEKLRMVYLFGSEGMKGFFSYLVTFVLVIAGLIVFIQCYKWMVEILKKYWLKKVVSQE